MNRTWMFGSSGLVTVLLTVLHVLLWGAGIGHAEQVESEVRVGVVVTLSVNATDDQTVRLATTLGRALEAKFLVDTLAGDELPEVEVADDCIARPSCVQALARDLGVDQVLLLTVVRVGERFQVAVTWGDGDDGRTVSRVSIDIDVEQQDPEPVFAVYATRLLPDAEKRPAPDERGSNVPGDPDGDPGDGTDPFASGSRADMQSGRRMTSGAWIAAGVGAAFLAGGIGFGLSARSSYNELEGRDCRTVMCADEDIDKVASRALLADAFFGAAVLAGVTSAILYWRSGGSRSSARVGDTDVAAYATQSGFGVTLGGHF